MSELNTTEENTQTLIINKGSAAGGARQPCASQPR